MEWRDAAILLSARGQGESSLILSVLTQSHGRHKGLARGAQRGRTRGLYQPGAAGEAQWQARLEAHLGQMRFDIETAHAAALLDDGLRLGCLEAAAALIDLALPERTGFPETYRALAALLQALAQDRAWAPAYLQLELIVLAELGFGLALDRCAVTGTPEDLAYVSPKTGRAVSRGAGEAYRDRLLRLPRCLGAVRAPSADEAPSDLLDGLALTGVFLERWALAPVGLGLPEARARYLDRWRRIAAASAATTTGVGP